MVEGRGLSDGLNCWIADRRKYRAAVLPLDSLTPPLMEVVSFSCEVVFLVPMICPLQ